jgi:hypothetical protein
VKVGGLFVGQGTLEVQFAYLETQQRKSRVSIEMEAQKRFQEMEKYGKRMHVIQNGLTIVPEET